MEHQPSEILFYLVFWAAKAYIRLYHVDPARNALHPSPFSGRGLEDLYGGSNGPGVRVALGVRRIADAETCCAQSVSVN